MITRREALNQMPGIFRDMPAQAQGVPQRPGVFPAVRPALPFEGNMQVPPGAKYAPPLGGLRGPVGLPVPVVRPSPVIGSLKRGGKVKKTGTYKLHAGERVVPARGVKDVESHQYNFRKDRRGKKKNS